MKKRFASTILVAIFAFSTLIGCGNNQPATTEVAETETPAPVEEETGTEIEPTEDVTGLAGTVIRFTAPQLPAETYAVEMERLIANFYELTGIIVEMELIEADAYRTWLTVQHTANNAPDIMDLNFNWAWEDYQRGYLIDITPHLALPNPFNNDLTLGDTLSPLLMDQAPIPGSGAIPVVPSRVAGVKIAYNKDLFEQAGITEVPFTLDEFIAASEALRESGVTPLAFANLPASANMNWMLHNFVSQIDADLRAEMDLDGDGRVALNELAAATYHGLIDFSAPPFTEAFTILRDFSQHWNSDFNSVDAGEVLNMFLGGRAAMVLLHSGSMPLLEETELGFDYGLLMFPALTTDNHPNASGRPLNNGGRLVDGYAINANSSPENQEAAIKFMMYMLSPEPLTTFMEVLNTLPPLTEEAMPLSEHTRGWLTSEREDILRAIYFGNATSRDFTEFQVMSSQIFLLSPDMTPEEWGAELNAEWQRAMEAVMLENDWGPHNNWGLED